MYKWQKHTSWVTFGNPALAELRHAFSACNCVLKVINLIGSNQGNYFEIATACSKTHSENDCRNVAFCMMFPVLPTIFYVSVLLVMVSENKLNHIELIVFYRQSSLIIWFTPKVTLKTRSIFIGFYCKIKSSNK